MSLIPTRPSFDAAQINDFVAAAYGLEIAESKPLPSERDQNFLIRVASNQRFVVKISNAAEPVDNLVAQSAMLSHLSRSVDVCPTVIPTRSGHDRIEIVDPQGVRYPLRVVSFLEGKPLAGLRFRPPELMVELGHCIGKFTVGMQAFDHPAFHRVFHWDLAHSLSVVESRWDLITDPQQRDWVQTLVQQFRTHVVPRASQLRQSVIQNDANDGNLIIHQAGIGQPLSVVGLIDFGDAVYSWTVADLAIAIAYAILETANPLSAAGKIVAGYAQHFQLTTSELESLWGLVGMRLCVSCVMALESSQLQPDDPYLVISQQPIRRLMPKLTAIPYGFATCVLKQSAGQFPPPTYDRVRQWLQRNSDQFEFPLSDKPRNDSLIVLDLSVDSAMLPSLRNSTPSEIAATLDLAISNTMNSAGAVLGVGRYLEPRLIYATDQFGDNANREAERRTIHLGIDLFVAADLDVCATLGGVVHFVGTIDQPLDYGTLVILRHQTELGDEFFTLYGHLATRTVEAIRIGQPVASGETIGWIGATTENGGWPPHLHFQIIVDLLGLEENFPGVGQASCLEVWSSLCPDPNLVLQIPASCFPQPSPSKVQTAAKRKSVTGGNLSLSYRQPLKIVRGWMQYLYDETGREYLDTYNNVPHVGHCHPRIIAAAHRQWQRLNTNTRYLSDLFNEFADTLSATLPSGLEICYLLNSASEANELALRLARSYTRARDVIVLEGAYHGHTSSLIDISPYKHATLGGEGAPAWVHMARVADTYRGPFRELATAGQSYANDIDVIIDSLRDSQTKLCAFIAESCPSVGGQIIFPHDYLRSVYESVRRAGGVCIADDVQTGYGRLGSAFYGFELQQVVPDIVVLGKPIGNGHPLAAVVTTRSIAESFNNGMEFFSTFGGNTVSSAIGIEVLKTVLEEQLPAHALHVGSTLTKALNQLKHKHSIIGDVRGSGLFLGVELVRDRLTLEPATAEASFIVNRMRDRGVLIGTEGPWHNVLKVRPPMPFNLLDAAVFSTCLDDSLNEL